MFAYRLAKDLGLLVEQAVENALDEHRYRDQWAAGVIDTQIILIEIVPRLQPLAEFVITVEVKYNYLRGTQ